MYFYIKGKITSVLTNKIVIENSGVGYDIYVSHANNFKVDDVKQIFIYEHRHEDISYLVGFDNLKEKSAFLKLIDVNGLGPRTALNILSKVSFDQLMDAISNGNVSFLKKIPGVGSKCAAQIMLDLKDKINDKKETNNSYNDVYSSLRELGFKKQLIDEVLDEIGGENLSSEELLKLALQRLGKSNG